MSTLCCAMVVGGSDALSPMRIRVPAAGEPDLSGDDEAATTPEASTDSENDSSFESDEDGRNGSGRKSPSRPSRGWLGYANSSKQKQLQQQQRQQQEQKPQPLRRVRFTLDDNNQGNNISGALYRGWGKGQRAAIRDSALADVGMMRPAGLAQQRVSTADAPGQRIIKKTTTSKSATDGGARRVWRKRTAAAAPFKSTSTNISTTSASAAAAAASAQAPFRHGTPYPATPTPASPKKQKLSAPLLLSPSSRARGDVGRRSRGAAAAMLRAAATAPELRAKRAAAAAKTAGAAGAGAEPMALSCEEELDLTCREELDLSREGEIRTPICRFLLPRWPEGVEGYEEAGGWRRLGGSHTRESFPRGRRCI